MHCAHQLIIVMSVKFSVLSHVSMRIERGLSPPSAFISLRTFLLGLANTIGTEHCINQYEDDWHTLDAETRKSGIQDNET